jgi:hypothetical protein
MWMLPSIPYLEEYDREDLAKGTQSALYRFFNTHVIVPMVAATRRYEEALLLKCCNAWQTLGSVQPKQARDGDGVLSNPI